MNQLLFSNSKSAFTFDKKNTSLSDEVIKAFPAGGDIFKKNFQRTSLLQCQLKYEDQMLRCGQNYYSLPFCKSIYLGKLATIITSITNKKVNIELELVKQNKTIKIDKIVKRMFVLFVNT